MDVVNFSENISINDAKTYCESLGYDFPEKNDLIDIFDNRAKNLDYMPQTLVNSMYCSYTYVNDGGCSGDTRRWCMYLYPTNSTTVYGSQGAWGMPKRGSWCDGRPALYPYMCVKK